MNDETNGGGDGSSWVKMRKKLDAKKAATNVPDDTYDSFDDRPIQNTRYMKKLNRAGTNEDSTP